MSAGEQSEYGEERPAHEADSKRTGSSAQGFGPPTLTEVVDLSGLPGEPGYLEDDEPDEAGLGLASADAALPTPEQLVHRVLTELSTQIDVMLEYRLREILGPLLARAADNVVRDARSELASTLRDVVARAVAAELARHRQR